MLESLVQWLSRGHNKLPRTQTFITDADRRRVISFGRIYALPDRPPSANDESRSAQQPLSTLVGVLKKSEAKKLMRNHQFEFVCDDIEATTEYICLLRTGDFYHCFSLRDLHESLLVALSLPETGTRITKTDRQRILKLARVLLSPGERQPAPVPRPPPRPPPRPRPRRVTPIPLSPRAPPALIDFTPTSPGPDIGPAVREYHRAVGRPR